MSQHLPNPEATPRLEDVLQQTKRVIENPDRYIDDSSVDWRDYLHVLGCSLRKNFLARNDRQFLELAIQCLRKTVAATSPDDPEVDARRLDLALLCCDRFKLEGGADDIEEAIHLGYLVLEDVPDMSSGRSTVLMVLSGLLGDRFAHGSNRDPADAHVSIKLGKMALDRLDLQDNRRLECIRSLGATYGDLFARTGDLKYIEEAMQYQQRALSLVPERTTNRALGLYNLSACFRQRYMRLRELEDLQQAIMAAQSALEIPHLSYSDQAGLVHQLSGCLVERFSRTKNRPDLDEAIRRGKWALARSIGSAPEQVIFSGDLCIAMQSLFLLTKDLPHIQEAISYGRYALEKTEEAHKSDFNLVHNLATCYAYRSAVQEATKESDIDEAIRLEELALRKAPEHHPHVGDCLQGLALYYRSKYMMSDMIADAEHSVKYATRALRCANTAPLTRVMAGLSAASVLAIVCQRWDESMAVFEESLDLLPTISPHTTARPDLQESLRRLPNSASLAASAALKAGRDPMEAVKILEKGRGVMESFVMNARSDLSLLKEKHGDLYRRYVCLRDKLALPVEVQPLNGGSGLGQGNHHALELLRRSKVATDLDETIREIHQTPGFELVFGTMQQKDILKLAAPYPIAYINISVVSAEAFLIKGDKIECLPLPGLTRRFLVDMLLLWSGDSRLGERDGKLLWGSTSSTSRASIDIKSAMLTLWKEAVKPVLKRLGFMEEKQTVKSDALPRLCWIGSEMASMVPFHAAGDHSLGSTDNAMSHVVSSYATTLKSLQYIRREMKTPNLVTLDAVLCGPQRLLIAAMPTTPGIAGQLAVEEEVAAVIQSAAAQHHSITAIMQPSKEDILNGLPDCTIFHFAGHGRVDPDDPAQSALCVGRVSAEEVSVRDLDPMRHSAAQVAYLSACSTAEAASRQLIDENMHLAGAFTLAGFPSVVGTLWKAGDTPAVRIAGEFYRQLGNHSGMARGESVARALHEAILRLRRCGDSDGDPSKWAPFVHLGD
jgi:tetratricopeptide (TPR) repeat protein